MKPRLIFMTLTAVLWTGAATAQTQQDEEPVISDDAFEQIELDAGSDVVTRGSSHTGNISEIHLNADVYRTGKRGVCIKMNPTIPGNTPWACLYAGGRSWGNDPLVFTQIRTLSVESAREWTLEWEAFRDISRLLHDAFISNKRCQIVYGDATADRPLNPIRIISCYNR